MFKGKTRAREYGQVKMEHGEVSVSYNFKFILKLRYKLEKRCENEIKRDGNGDDMMENEKDGCR